MTKKLKFLAFALIAVLTCVGFASCGDDDDKDEPTNNSIVGKWNCYKVVESNGDASQQNIDFDFKADKSVKVNYYTEDMTLTGKYTTSDAGAIKINFDGRDDIDLNGTYTISGNEMTVKFDWRLFGSGTAYLKRSK